MSEIAVRAYRGEDEGPLLALWNAALPLDPLNPATFRRKVLLDPNFDPGWLLLAEEQGALLGFCLCLIRRVPLEKTGMQPEAGWISAFGVHPEARRQGAGTALLDRALALFRAEGRQSVAIASYIPNYFVPGVDVTHYADGLAFLQRRGFEELDRPMSMDTQLVGRDLEPFVACGRQLQQDHGVEVRAMRPTEIPALMALLQAHMPGDWVRHAREVLLDISRGQGDFDQFTIARLGDEVVGYCQFEGEHFGPFGVREGMQGKGIGTVLLATCLQAMQRRGLHTAFVLWTSDANADKVYARFGFRETRRFSVVRRSL
ncbi:MAG: GNAT family N-acetyltransferase [Candidatus Latescibacterota bacterium]|jgi:GNAT superfamily N-acetyltransferase